VDHPAPDFVARLQACYAKAARLPYYACPSGVPIFGTAGSLALRESDLSLAVRLTRLVIRAVDDAFLHQELGNPYDVLNEAFGHFVRDNFRGKHRGCSVSDAGGSGRIDGEHGIGGPEAGWPSLRCATAGSGRPLLWRGLVPGGICRQVPGTREPGRRPGSAAVEALWTRQGGAHGPIDHGKPDALPGFRPFRFDRQLAGTPGVPVHPGEVLLSRINPRIPRALVVPDLGQPILCSGEFEVMRPKKGVDPYMITFLLLSRMVQTQIQSLTSGTSASHNRVKTKELAQLSLPVPRSGSESAKELKRKVARYREVLTSMMACQQSLVEVREDEMEGMGPKGGSASGDVG
jgi:hypothetical protein